MGKKKETMLELLETAELSTLLDITPQWVRDLTRKKVLTKIKTGTKEGYEKDASITAYIRYLKQQKSGSESLKDEKIKAEIRWKEAKATTAELQLKELEGRLHAAEDVEAVMNDFIYIVRGIFMALPGRFAIDLAPLDSPVEISEHVQKEVYRILEDLSRYQYDPDTYKERVLQRIGWIASEETEEITEI